MNVTRIETLKREINALERRLYFVDTYLKSVSRLRADVKNEVIQLKSQPIENKEKIDSAESYLEDTKQEYDRVCGDYRGALEEIRRKTNELRGEERRDMNLQRIFHR